MPGSGWSAVRWTTWRDMLRQLQMDLLLEGNAVTFDWQDLVRRLQGLAASPARCALDLPTAGAGESDAKLRAYRQQAVQALAELQATPREWAHYARCCLQFGQDHAVAVTGVDATPEAGAHPANQPGPLALEPLFPLVGPVEETVDLRAKGKVGSNVAPSEPLQPQANPPGQVSRRQGARRRTLRAIVERHPRPGGKAGFMVRELCAGLRINAASLTEARLNPGHLSVEKVMALAEMMGESPLHVFYDLMTEASAKPRRKRKKRVTPLQRPKKSTLA